MSEFLPVDREAIVMAAACLARGGIVCLPTETTYGLAVLAEDREALARLAALKGREAGSAFGLIVPNAGAARALASVWPAEADRLAARWPAPLTLVVPARPGLPAEIVGPGGGVGVRMSPHPWAAGLAEAVGAPITATSANPSGEPPALTAEQARGYFGDRVDAYLDAGRARAPSASTVVAIGVDAAVTILRHGVFDIDTD
jgi:L-threonylcarbamoyladenylate synthase